MLTPRTLAPLVGVAEAVPEDATEAAEPVALVDAAEALVEALLALAEALAADPVAEVEAAEAVLAVLAVDAVDAVEAADEEDEAADRWLLANRFICK